MTRRSPKIGSLVLPVLALLAFAVQAAWAAWNSAGDVEMGGHGVVAMILGALLTILIAAVPIGLLLYGRRHDYDR